MHQLLFETRPQFAIIPNLLQISPDLWIDGRKDLQDHQLANQIQQQLAIAKQLINSSATNKFITPIDSDLYQVGLSNQLLQQLAQIIVSLGTPSSQQNKFIPSYAMRKYNLNRMNRNYFYYRSSIPNQWAITLPHLIRSQGFLSQAFSLAQLAEQKAAMPIKSLHQQFTLIADLAIPEEITGLTRKFQVNCLVHYWSCSLIMMISQITSKGEDKLLTFTSYDPSMNFSAIDFEQLHQEALLELTHQLKFKGQDKFKDMIIAYLKQLKLNQIQPTQLSREITQQISQADFAYQADIRLTLLIKYHPQLLLLQVMSILSQEACNSQNYIRLRMNREIFNSLTLYILVKMFALKIDSYTYHLRHYTWITHLGLSRILSNQTDILQAIAGNSNMLLNNQGIYYFEFAPQAEPASDNNNLIAEEINFEQLLEYSYKYPQINQRLKHYLEQLQIEIISNQDPAITSKLTDQSMGSSVKASNNDHRLEQLRNLFNESK